MNILNQDSLVYYWRTKLEQPTEIESKEWATTSFIFINGSSEGWSQSEFPQLLENGLEGLTRDTFSNTLKFVETSATIAVKTFGNSNPALSTDVSVKLNGVEYNLGTQGQPCRDNTINFIAFDKKTLVPYAGLPFNFQDPRTCGREPQVINSFTLSELETGSGDDLVAMVDNIKASDSVLIFSIGDAGIASWSSAVQTKLNLLGIQSSQLSSLQPGDPLVIFGRKGAAVGTATLFTASGSPANAQALEVTETITGKYTSGTLNSVLIGPAKQWNKLVAQAKMIEADDQYNFSLFGVALSGKEELIQDPISGNFDLATVDASAYPYLKLSLHTTDEINLSPVQLKKWMVLYEPVADGLLLYNGTKAQVALQEGQDWAGNFSFVNISNKQFLDSLQVNFTVISTSQSKKEVKVFKIKAPAPGDSTGFSVATGTLGKSGFNSLDIFVNPRVIPEQYFENNVVSLPDYLNVIADKINPVLSVTIDNRQIASGDFVSLNPFIQISLTDENQYLLKIDTLGMKIFLRRPCNQTECPVERIYLKRDDVKWFAATATSDFRIEYRPQALSKGTYLLTVEGTDASGNQSGAIPYQVEFQVEEETTVTFQSVYPNPSSSDFVFSFTLTGNVTPTDFSLIINSLTGAVQQQFHFTDVSEFHIGNNTVIWSPKDVGGNDLLGGMYLFRMKVSVNGKLYSQSGKLIVVR